MSYISVCYNEGCGGAGVFEHPRPVTWICDDCLEKSKLPEPEKVSRGDFEEAVAYLRAAASVINQDLRNFDRGGILTAETVATTGRVMRSLSKEILKLLKEKY